MAKRFLVIPILTYLWCLISTAATAQHLHLINASSQSWSGGIAGHYGCNYGFDFEFVGSVHDYPVPDTVWVEGEPFPLSLPDSNGAQGTIRLTFKKNRVHYNFGAGTSHDEDRGHPEFLNKKEHQNARPKPPVPIAGVALVSYKYQGKKYYVQVPKFTGSLPPINYP